MRDGLKERYESFYRQQLDPWDYWRSEYEIRKYREQISLVAQFGTPRRILEIACSTGAHTKLIHETFPEAKITAVDISPTAIARASSNVNAPQSVNFQTADIFSFAEALEAGSIDAIFWSEAFEFLHEHYTFAEFSRLIYRLNMSLARNGILCISHITPNPLFYTTVESGQKNIRVFHELIRDYFHQVASASNTVRKAEVDRVYRYDTKLYRPRLVERPPAGSDEICIDLVDVVIPARDEVETIANVITAIQRSPRVGRVIVVDNGSVDDTARVAVGAGAFVVQCPERGYGRAVKRGLRESERRWVLKLDADLENTDAAWPELLIDCAIRERSRLTKAYWTASTEDPDRVTNFTVKPAFRIFFQELLFLQSPLSGIYLFDRQAFNLSELPNGFSFDVALLISALRSGETISQAEIETVRHATIANGKRTYQHYYNMSHELLSFIVEAGIERLQ